MAENPETNGLALPPKLDLRKKGILKTPQTVTPAFGVPSVPEAPVAAPEAPVAAVAPAAPVTPVMTPAAPVSPAPPAVPVPVAPAAPVASSAASSPRPMPIGAPRPAVPGTVRLRPKIPLSPAGAVVPVAIKPIGPAAPPPAASMPKAPVAVPPPPGKRKTSRIPLEGAQAGGEKPEVAAMAPKTIRIKPISVDAADPASAEAPAAKSGVLGAPGGAEQGDPKRQTSRISLEAALGSEDRAGGSPKTIRLKRPAEAGTVKVTRPDASGAPMGKTAEIDAPEEASDDDSDAALTQKKTIKVKRPMQRRAVKSVSVARRPGEGGQDADGVPMAASVGMPGGAARAVDSAHWTFITFAIVSVIVSLTIIYMLAAQACGPDFSLTQLSYGLREMDLPWPGKLVR